MLDYVVAGLALGAIYSICASGLIVTYVSSGVFNFAFASIAYFLARFFYFLDSEQGWSTVPALLVTLVVVAPAMGAALYGVLFRHLAQSSTLVKVVVTVGLSVAIPAAARLLFGSLSISQVPGLATAPVKVYRVGGVNINLDQVFVLLALLLLVAVGGLLLRFTSVGLQVRAAVDSAALTSLTGVSPQRVQCLVWMVSTALAGLAGVLVAPIIGLMSDQFVVVMNAAIAAVIAARLTRVGIGILAGLLMGIASSVAQWALPPSSSVTAAVLPSIPFALILLVLLYNGIRGRRADEGAGAGGALDRAIRPASDDSGGAGGSMRSSMHDSRRRARSVLVSPGALCLLVVVALLPISLLDFWVGLIAQGIAMSVVFLSITIATGQGGMVWLHHATLAGVGGLTYAQLTTLGGHGAILALLVSGLVTAVAASLIAALTSRLGTLYVALVTLSAGLLIETLIFARDRFSQNGAGVGVTRPGFMESDRSFAYVALGIFCVLALATFNLRRSTAGLVLAAIRSSEPGARSLGIDILWARLIAATLAGFTAGIGGSLVVLYSFSASPGGFATIGGLTWLAIVVSIGVRSASAALVAGLVLGLVPGVFATYLPTSVGELPAVLFGLGAILVARNPDGVVAMHAAQVRWLLGRALAQRRRGRPQDPGGSDGQTPVHTVEQREPTGAAR